MNSAKVSDDGNAKSEPSTERGRSTIDFPYFDQDDAIAIAQAVHAVGGTTCSWDQLASKMGQVPKGGGFRIKVMAARSFGVLTYDRGTVSLTDLGLHIIDPKFARKARVESFLAVDLFKAIFEKLKGGMLPPVAAIERAMETVGVAPKQKGKARQVFIRSAKQAGFFEIDQNRLTYPPNIGVPTAGIRDEQKPQGRVNGGGNFGSGGGDNQHPFIKGLLDKLPTPETEWPVQARAKWLQTASNIFDLMYKPAADDQAKSIEVTISHL
jgi:hypothetical protein